MANNKRTVHHKKTETRDSVIRHAGIFTDFWLGLAAATFEGAAAAIGKPSPANAPEKTFEKRLEAAIDGTARGLQVAFDGAKVAAQVAQGELGKAHGETNGKANGKSRKAHGRTNGKAKKRGAA